VWPLDLNGNSTFERFIFSERNRLKQHAEGESSEEQ
jgi:hypothetical protein